MSTLTPFFNRDHELIRLFWTMAAERRSMEIKRRLGDPPPWTDDAVLAFHRFTNTYRASDRVSQYLIRNVQYTGDQEPKELVFRTLVFKLFNQIGTWKHLCDCLHEQPSLSNWDPDEYSYFLDAYKILGFQIWNNAYMITPPLSTYGGVKHDGWLRIFDRMWRDGVPAQIVEAQSLQEIYRILLAYPTVGKFFAYQWTIDINYSSATWHDENTFVVPGPGAVRGARKVFGTGLTAEDAIKAFTGDQEWFIEHFGLHFPFLGANGNPYHRGRKLHLVDVQSLFCEFDKYTRVARPDLDHRQAGYARIKQSYKPVGVAPLPPAYYPPKWGLNSESPMSMEVVL